jgi:hypothetical protein
MRNHKDRGQKDRKEKGSVPVGLSFVGKDNFAQSLSRTNTRARTTLDISGHIGRHEKHSAWLCFNSLAWLDSDRDNLTISSCRERERERERKKERR